MYFKKYACIGQKWEIEKKIEIMKLCRNRGSLKKKN
jgi:hypothetical protein